MREQPLWLFLLDLAQRMDIQVRLENLDVPEADYNNGGLCLLNGRKIIFIDKRLGHEARLKVLGRALVGQNVEQFHMLPMVRCFLEDLEGVGGADN